jgi:hypothetical protein
LLTFAGNIRHRTNIGETSPADALDNVGYSVERTHRIELASTIVYVATNYDNEMRFQYAIVLHHRWSIIIDTCANNI